MFEMIAQSLGYGLLVGIVIGVILGVLLVKLIRGVASLWLVMDEAHNTSETMKRVNRAYQEMSTAICQANEKVRELDKNIHFIKKIEQLEQSQLELKRVVETQRHELNEVKRKQL